MTDRDDNSTPKSDVYGKTQEDLASFREFIAANLQMACFEADMGVRYASAGDDFGLTYAIRRLVAHIKAAIAIHADLQASKSPEQRS